MLHNDSFFIFWFLVVFIFNSILEWKGTKKARHIRLSVLVHAMKNSAFILDFFGRVYPLFGRQWHRGRMNASISMIMSFHRMWLNRFRSLFSPVFLCFTTPQNTVMRDNLDSVLTLYKMHNLEENERFYSNDWGNNWTNWDLGTTEWLKTTTDWTKNEEEKPPNESLFHLNEKSFAWGLPRKNNQRIWILSRFVAQLAANFK